MSTLEVKAIQAPTGYDLVMPAGAIIQTVSADIGALTTSSVAITPIAAGQALISINGVIQEPDNAGTTDSKYLEVT